MEKFTTLLKKIRMKNIQLTLYKNVFASYINLHTFKSTICSKNKIKVK
jgi:hypothetical protein